MFRAQQVRQPVPHQVEEDQDGGKGVAERYSESTRAQSRVISFDGDTTIVEAAAPQSEWVRMPPRTFLTPDELDRLVGQGFRVLRLKRGLARAQALTAWLRR